jgi:hypothetical protein
VFVYLFELFWWVYWERVRRLWFLMFCKLYVRVFHFVFRVLGELFRWVC